MADGPVEIKFDFTHSSPPEREKAHQRKQENRKASEEARERRAAAAEERADRKRQANEERSRRLIDYRQEKAEKSKQERQARQDERVAAQRAERDRKKAERDAERARKKREKEEADPKPDPLDDALSAVAGRLGLGSVYQAARALAGPGQSQSQTPPQQGNNQSPTPPTVNHGGPVPPPPRIPQKGTVPNAPPRANAPSPRGGIVPPPPPNNVVPTASPAPGGGGASGVIKSTQFVSTLISNAPKILAVAAIISTVAVTMKFIAEKLVEVHQSLEKVISEVGRYNSSLAYAMAQRNIANVRAKIEQANQLARNGGVEFIRANTEMDVELRRAQTEFYKTAIPVLIPLVKDVANLAAIFKDYSPLLKIIQLMQNDVASSTTVLSGIRRLLDMSILRFLKDETDTKVTDLEKELMEFMGMKIEEEEFKAVPLTP